MAVGICLVPLGLLHADGPFEDSSPSWIHCGQSTPQATWNGLEELRDGGEALANNSLSGTLFRWGNSVDTTGGPDLNEPLVTDRPDFTEASSTVGRGVTQIEMGYTYSYDNADGESTRVQSWGEPLLRQGVVADWLELRLGLFPLAERTKDASTSNTTAGTADLYVGFKIALTPQASFLPEMALIPQATVPTGSPQLTNDEVLLGLNWIYSWDVTEQISVAGSTQFNRVVEELEPIGLPLGGRVPNGGRNAYTEWAQSATVGVSLTDEWGAYAEWFAFFPHSADTAQVEHFVNGGITWLVSNDIQWDVRAGWGLNEAADDFFSGTGLSIRFR